MSDEEDEYVTFGKHLKEIAEGDTIRKRPISVEEQIVTDENGKRRFHGAFTGGFSAGFFNTVDTPQGWVPSQFKSSRSSRRPEAAVAQRPEDFMDSEDLGDFGFAAQAIRTKSNFQSKTDGPPAKSVSSSILGKQNNCISINDAYVTA
jgi:G patch domain-containing protein 1